MNGAESDTSASIIQALETIYNPQSSNETRRLATLFLENAKTRPEAPTFGYSLAVDTNNNAIVRHYGLSLLDFTIRHRWDVYDDQQKGMLRSWVVQFARTVTERDIKFLRSKIGQLWVEITKRSWPMGWQEMDKTLIELWSISAIHQELVLHILETLSEEAFHKDELSLSFRGMDLGKAWTEIFTPPAVLAELFPLREFETDLSNGGDGWLHRLVAALTWRLDSGVDTQEATSNVRDTLAVLCAAMPWVIPDALVNVDCIAAICRCLRVPEQTIQLAALEALHALYHRTTLRDQDIVALACPLLRPDMLALLQQLYVASQVDVNDIDAVAYLILKRLSETLCALGMFLQQRPLAVYRNCDVPGLLNLLMEILQNTSLVISVPVLYLWTRLLSAKDPPYSSELMHHIATLLNVCSQRLIRYEALPEDSQETTFLFLNADFDTMPERHAFVGNYRRFCTEAVDHIISKAPLEAMPYIISQAETAISSLYTDAPAFSRSSYASVSPTVLRADAQSTVLITAVRGFVTWMNSSAVENAEAKAAILDSLGYLCQKLINANFEDPVIQKRVLQLVVEIAKAAFENKSDLPISICEQTFIHGATVDLSTTPYGDAMRDLQSSRPRELQKLAFKFADAFMSVYPALENGVETMLQVEGLDQRIKLEYQAFLFIIIQRADEIDDDLRCSKLQSLLQPVVDAWHDPNLGGHLTSFASFLELLGIDKFPAYFLSKEAWKIEDWSKLPLDTVGQSLRDEVSPRNDKLPLLATRTLLSASTDRVRAGSSPHSVAMAIWRDGVPTIVPQLLQMMSHAHAFSNPERWSEYPEEMKTIIQRILVDRVWQSGISTESRDDFYAKVRESKSALEGLASTVRGAVRNIRELSYWILHCMTNFGDAFYGHTDLPDPLANALYTDAYALAPHQYSALLKLSGALIEGCPPECRVPFLTPVMYGLFQQLERKLSIEWTKVQNRSTKDVSEEVLDQEMKIDAELRQLTHTGLMLIASVVELPNAATRTPTFRTIILSTPFLLESLVVLLSHALRIPDHRATGLVTRLLRTLMPEFTLRPSPNGKPPKTEHEPSPTDTTTNPDNPPNAPTAAAAAAAPQVAPATAGQVRAYVATETLQAAITSLNEPYFVEVQKELALLIAAIINLWAHSSSHDTDARAADMPRNVLRSLPTLDRRRIDTHLAYIRASPAHSERSQRASVLSLLEGVRGVGIHEAGRIVGDADGFRLGSTRQKKSGGGGGGAKVHAAFMQVDGGAGSGILRGGSPEGGALEDLFG